MTGTYPQQPARDAWGPRDWCASGDGGEQFELLPTDPAADPDPDPHGEPGPERAPAEPADPAARARALCLRLLTGSPRTRRQLVDAMRKRELPEEVIDEVLSRYEEVGLIDDAAFADAWVESRQRSRGLARRALSRELRSRGVDAAVVAEAVDRLDPEQEAETARELVRRKLRSTRGLDRQVRIRRLAGMLARRGYPEGLALRVVREAVDADRAEHEEAGYEREKSAWSEDEE
ncbi:recombination regulator RecX [Streptacidiphilus sp. EB129]|uniref:recombination regulator RecX n=1 Tax=Streptacidiphilus sp. EB129 TaxID=3156262 RepID=UPI003517FAA4